MLTSCVDTTKKEGRTGWLGHKCQSQPQPRHDVVGRFFASFTFPITISCACQSCFYTLALPLLCCSSSLVSTGFTFPSTAPCRPFSQILAHSSISILYAHRKPNRSNRWVNFGNPLLLPGACLFYIAHLYPSSTRTRGWSVKHDRPEKLINPSATLWR